MVTGRLINIDFHSLHLELICVLDTGNYPELI